MRRSSDFYKVLNAVCNSVANGVEVPYLKSDGTRGAFTRQDEDSAIRAELLDYLVADDDRDMAGDFAQEHEDCDIWTLTIGKNFICIAVDPFYYITKSYELRDMILNEIGSPAEITEGSNGYPRALRGAVLLGGEGLSFADMEALAEKYGVEVVSLRRRGGWNLWESQGRAFGLYDVYDIYSHVEPYVWSDFKEFAQELREVAEDMESEELAQKADEVESLELGENEFIYASDLPYYDTTERIVDHYTWDVWEYELALDCSVNE